MAWGFRVGLVKRLAPHLVGRAVLGWLWRPAQALIRVGYYLKFLAWSHRAGLRAKLLDPGEVPTHARRERLYADLLARLSLETGPMWYLEFGVARGESIRWWSTRNTHTESRFIGHDSFEGLPDAWAAMPRGAFSTGGQLPAIDDPRVSFVKGWFRDTVGVGLPPRPGEGHRLVVNLDADLYGSTTVALHALFARLRAGDVLIFDEFAYPMDEFRAFLDYVDAYGTTLSIHAAVNCGDVIAFVVGEPAPRA